MWRDCPEPEAKVGTPEATVNGGNADPHVRLDERVVLEPQPYVLRGVINGFADGHLAPAARCRVRVAEQVAGEKLIDRLDACAVAFRFGARARLADERNRREHRRHNQRDDQGCASRDGDPMPADKLARAVPRRRRRRCERPVREIVADIVGKFAGGAVPLRRIAAQRLQRDPVQLVAELADQLVVPRPPRRGRLARGRGVER
jgi:hypothetical protein